MDTSIIVAIITSSFALFASLGGIYLNHRLEKGVKNDKINAEIQKEYMNDIAFIVTKILSDHEYFFLAEIDRNSEYSFKNNHRDKEHLRRLRDLEMITQSDRLQNISSLKRGDTLRDMFLVLPAGKKYLKIRNRVTQ